MHREIIGAKKGQITDHINRIRLDNRKKNLRIVTAQGNARNRPKRKGCTSKYIGVHLCKRSQKFRATYRYINGQRAYLGSFKTESQAKRAYDKHKKQAGELNAR